MAKRASRYVAAPNGADGAAIARRARESGDEAGDRGGRSRARRCLGRGGASAGGEERGVCRHGEGGADPAAVAAANGVSPTMVFDAVGGFAADLTTKQVNRLRSDAAVESVEVDGVVASIPTTSAAPLDQPAQAVKAAVRRVGGLESPTAKIDGIDERIDVDIAVLDSGIQRDHPDLNVAGGFNCLRGNKEDWADRDGHGTMVAGYAAAIDNGIGVVGVAPGARVWAIRVAKPNGMINDSALMCGLNWVIKHANKIEVVNMSLAGIIGVDEPAKALSPCGARPRFREHEAICKMVRRGVTTVVAAGNDSMDAAMVVPAAYPEVITVSAMADFDGQPGGLATIPRLCLPRGAVGRSLRLVLQLRRSGRHRRARGVRHEHVPGQSVRVGDGTSFSTPFVAGAAALYISTHRTPARPGAAALVAGRTRTDPWRHRQLCRTRAQHPRPLTARGQRLRRSEGRFMCPRAARTA